MENSASNKKKKKKRQNKICPHQQRTGIQRLPFSYVCMYVRTYVRTYVCIVLSGPWLCYFTMEFEITWQKCQPSWDDVSRARPRSVAHRSWSHLRVKGDGGVIRTYVCIVLSGPWLCYFTMEFWNYLAEMSTIMRRCVARKTKVCSSQVMVTLTGQR